MSNHKYVQLPLDLCNCRRGKSVLGPVTEMISREGKSTKTVMRQHTGGMSITRFRKYFGMLDGKRVVNSDVWVVTRHMEFHGKAAIDKLVEM